MRSWEAEELSCYDGLWSSKAQPYLTKSYSLGRNLSFLLVGERGGLITVKD